MIKEKAFLGISSTLANGSGKAQTTSTNPKAKRSRIRWLPTMTLANFTPLWAIVFFLLQALPAKAQFSQYVLPGEQLARTPADKDTVEKAMEEVPFRLGGLRWGPYLALRNIQYVDNVFGSATKKTSDVTATAAAGIHAYVPLGKRFLVGAYGVPEYVWWKELEGRRVWNGRYGVAVFGEGGRLRMEMRAGDHREALFLSSEFFQPVNGRDRFGQALLEARVGGHLWVFGQLSEHRYRFRQLDLETSSFLLANLERDERFESWGLRYRSGDRATVTFGQGNVETEFLRPDYDRSATGTAWFGEGSFRGARTQARVRIQRNDLKGTAGSQFGRFRGTTWSYNLGASQDRPFQWNVYGRRNIAFTVGPGTYLVERRLGLALGRRFHSSLAAVVFGEKGRNDYPQGVTGSGDVQSLGFRMDGVVGSRLGWGLGAARERWDRGVAGVLTVTRVNVVLRLAQSAAWW